MAGVLDADIAFEGAVLRQFQLPSSLNQRLVRLRHRCLSPKRLLRIGYQCRLALFLPTKHSHWDIAKSGIEEFPFAADVTRDIHRSDEVGVRSAPIEKQIATIGRQNDASIEA